MHFDDIFRSLTVYEPESSTCAKKKKYALVYMEIVFLWSVILSSVKDIEDNQESITRSLQLP